jgi:ankyrin repeat protein
LEWFHREVTSWCQRLEAVVKLLLTQDGLDPESRDNACGWTPISWAAAKGHEMVVKLLLEMDAVDPNSKNNKYYRTPLWWAASRAPANGNEAVVKLLLATNAVDLNSKDTKYGRTPLSSTKGAACESPRCSSPDKRS